MNFESIKLLRTAKREELHLSHLLRLYISRVLRFQFLHSRLKVVQKGVIATTLGILMWNAAADVATYTITPGDFVLVNAFALQILLPISTMGILWKEMHQNLADVQSLGPLVETAQVEPATAELKDLLVAPKIEFRNVTVRYPNGTFAFKNLSFIIPAGSFTVITGENGTGKTTILRLVSGLIQPTSGEILVDDQPKTARELMALGSAVGVVPQFVSLFHGSIAYNLTYGLNDVSIEKARELARLVMIEEMIDLKFQSGFETIVGERGQKLSGGERQKIGLARALAGDPKLLLMDEPTTSLDQMSQQQFLDAVAGSMQNRTVVMVTHAVDYLKGDVNYIELA